MLPLTNIFIKKNQTNKKERIHQEMNELFLRMKDPVTSIQC